MQALGFTDEDSAGQSNIFAVEVRLSASVSVVTLCSHAPAPFQALTDTLIPCVAFQLRVSVAVLLELTELAKPVEMPCLC